MSAYYLRFVGATQLPKNLSEFDVEQFFQLMPEDVAAIRGKFRPDRRFGPALQLVFLRATGRPLDGVATVPKHLLRHLAQALETQALTIASLRAIYKRRETLYEHQRWARDYSGLQEYDAVSGSQLVEVLHQLAKGATSVDELVGDARRWLFDRKTLIPADRTLRDLARQAFAGIEERAICTIRKAFPGQVLSSVVRAVFDRHEEATVLEWLKEPVGRHSVGTLAECSRKIAYLKGLGVHLWELDEITLERQRAYAQALAGRPPSDSRKRKGDTQTLEVVCFLRVALLDLTDATLYAAGRRISDLVRRASDKTQAKQARSATEYRTQLVKIKTLIHHSAKSAQEILSEIDALIDEEMLRPASSHAAMVRQTLTDEPTGVRPLLNTLAELEIQGQQDERTMRQLHALQQLQVDTVTQLPPGFDTGLADRGWESMLLDADRQRAMRAFEAATMLAVRKGLRSGRLWINHSLRFKDREQMLIPEADWKLNKAQYVALLKLPEDPHDLLNPLLANLQAGLGAVAEAVEQGALDHDDKGMRLSALQALPEESGAQRMRDALSSAMGQVQLPVLLLQADAAINFSETILGRKANTVQELLGIYGGLIAHGTEMDAKGVASMVPQLQASQVSTAMRMLEGQGRLRRANDRVVEHQGRFAIAHLWGSGEKASADMMALDASRHLYNARIDPRRRTFGVGLYTHVLDRYGITYDQPIVLMERQGGPAVEGVERHNTSSDERVRLSLLAVDTHGYTYPSVALAKLLGFDLCPQLRDVSERKLLTPRGMEIPENIDGLAVRGISLGAITKGWDQLLRLAASVRIGRVGADVALQRLGSAAQGDPLHRAADQFGRLLRSIYLCDYFTNMDFRREIHTLLNRGESVHQLQRAIYYGKVRHDRGRRRDEMKAISGAHALLTNIVMAWNTERMQGICDRWRKEGHPLDDDWLRRTGPVGFGHINFRGVFDFAVAPYAQSLLQPQAWKESSKRAAV